MQRSGEPGSGALQGRVLDGRYRIDSLIARGGMATVHLATDLRLDRTVAIKVMHDSLAHDDDFVRRFQREARATARLSHPGVVAVFDTGDDDGTLYLVMEHVPGRTLRQLIREEAPLPPVRALQLLESVLGALGAAHTAGIVHRDVKPENVLVADDPSGEQVKVADFGLSRAVSADTQHTATGEVLIGTVSYLSPELVVDGRADARADVYAAGVVLFELLTASKPHQADSPIQVAWKHVHDDVPPPSSRVEGIPDYLDALVARATARALELRSADGRVLLHQVRQVRLALEQGVASDADLTADLLPTLAASRLGASTDSSVALDETGTDELPDVREVREVVEQPELVGAVAAGAPTDRAGYAGAELTTEVYDQEREPTSPESTYAPPAGRAPLVPQQRGTDGPPTRPVRSRRSRRGPLALLLVLLLAGGAAAGGWWYGVARWTETPPLIGLTEAAATDRLGEQGLGIDVDTAYSETVRRGLVISSSPDTSDRVLDEGTVGVVLSLGPERYDVPDLAGETLDAAQQQLIETNLGYGGEVLRYSPRVPEGQVITTDPEAGTELRRDAAVDVVVSQGPRPIRVPDWTGRNADRATRVLGERGFEVASSRENSDTVTEGAVISQTPSDGTLVRGDTVTLVVSDGPVLVEVPRVVGSGVDAAQAQLEEAGFRVEIRQSELYIGVQYVVSQSPNEGLAPRGSTIVLNIV